MTTSDEILLRKMHAGDEAAAEELWSRHAGWMLGFARAVVGSRAGASPEDVVQAVFLRVLAQDRRTIRSVREPRPWLATLVRREALNELRGHRRRSRRHAAVARSVGEAPDPRGPDLAAAMAALPRRLREVLHLRHVLGLTTEQVAQALGVPRGTAASRHHAAVIMLRELMASDPQPFQQRPPQQRGTTHAGIV